MFFKNYKLMKSNESIPDFIFYLAFLFLHAYNYFIKPYTPFRNSYSLRVLLYHRIDSYKNLDKLRTQLCFLKNYWVFITPDEFEKLVCGEEELKNNSL